MKRDHLAKYMKAFTAELRKRGVFDSRTTDEAREHLLDAVENAQRRGLSHDLAVEEALDRFGTPIAVAAEVSWEKYRSRNLALLTIATSLGVVIAYVDSRPTWDDTGITALSMLLGAAVLGFVGPHRPWAWGWAIGFFVALTQFTQVHATVAAVNGLLILSLPLAGAYAGMFWPPDPIEICGLTA